MRLIPVLLLLFFSAFVPDLLPNEIPAECMQWKDAVKLLPPEYCKHEGDDFFLKSGQLLYRGSKVCFYNLGDSSYIVVETRPLEAPRDKFAAIYWFRDGKADVYGWPSSYDYHIIRSDGLITIEFKYLYREVYVVKCELDGDRMEVVYEVLDSTGVDFSAHRSELLPNETAPDCMTWKDAVKVIPQEYLKHDGTYYQLNTGERIIRDNELCLYSFDDGTLIIWETAYLNGLAKGVFSWIYVLKDGEIDIGHWGECYDNHVFSKRGQITIEFKQLYHEVYLAKMEVENGNLNLVYHARESDGINLVKTE